MPSAVHFVLIVTISKTELKDALLNLSLRSNEYPLTFIKNQTSRIQSIICISNDIAVGILLAFWSP